MYYTGSSREIARVLVQAPGFALIGRQSARMDLRVNAAHERQVWDSLGIIGDLESS